jgi:hypothetical protein
MDSQERGPQSDEMMVGDETGTTGARDEPAPGEQTPSTSPGDEAGGELGATEETGAGISAHDADREDPPQGGGGRPAGG